MVVLSRVLVVTVVVVGSVVVVVVCGGAVVVFTSVVVVDGTDVVESIRGGRGEGIYLLIFGRIVVALVTLVTLYTDTLTNGDNGGSTTQKEMYVLSQKVLQCCGLVLLASHR